MFTTQKMAVTLGLGVATLLAGFGPSARPAAAMTPTVTASQFTRSFYDQDGDHWQDRRQIDHDQWQRSQWDRDHRHGDRDGRPRFDRDDHRRFGDDFRGNGPDRRHDRDDHRGDWDHHRGDRDDHHQDHNGY